MKYGLLFFIVLMTQNAFALYGSKVESATERFVVSLLLDNQGFFCNGVLISPTKVLTAGHCISGMGLEVYDDSHGIIYNPKVLKIEAAGKIIRAKTVTFSPSYFEGSGHSAEDLALIELSSPFKNVTPIQIARRSLLKRGKEITLIARGNKVSSKLLQLKSFTSTSVLYIDKSAGACLGDSGGAVVVKEKNQQKLAGILMYNGDRTCYRKTGYGHFPKVRF